MNVQRRIDALEDIVDYHFSDRNLAEAALTHPSVAHQSGHGPSYERLEFLGDSVLGALIAIDMFERFPDMDEGKLTRLKIGLVSGKTLSEAGRELGLSELIMFNVKTEQVSSRAMKTALENVFEAVVGALYLDAGFEVAHSFIKKALTKYMSDSVAEQPISPKGYLQEYSQREMSLIPTYKIVDKSGPDHALTFRAHVFLGKKRMGAGSGATKKEAESQAALMALRELGLVDDAGHKQVNPAAPLAEVAQRTDGGSACI